MNCHSFNNVLDLYREGRLTTRRMNAAAKHLASCPACRALVKPLAASPSATAPRSLKDKLRALAKEGAPEASRVPSPRAAELQLWPREARGIALAAAALLVVGLLIAAAGAPSQSAGGAVAAVEEP
jgi:anti-sigma factor RsiW